jgi:exopolysaccharide production protein ExoZ
MSGRESRPLPAGMKLETGRLSPLTRLASMSRANAPADPARKSGQLVSLQYLRAVAAMMIVFTHGWDQLPWLKERIPNVAQSGVDLFFVISGFIMVYVTAKAGSSALHFMRMRIHRIVPLYWLYTFATAALLLAAPNLFKTSAFTVSHFLQSLLFIPHWGPTGSISPMILLGWTLNYEMFFYAIFAIAMAILAARRVPLAIAMLLVLPILGLLINFGGSAAGEFYSNEIILEFIFGMLLAPLFLNGVLDRVGAPIGIALIAAGIIGLCIGGYHFESSRALSFGVPAALIVAGALSVEATRHVAKVQPFLLLGDASYSIYLAHLFPIALLRFGWNRAMLPTDGLGPVLAFMAIALLCGALAGVASYLFLERPLLRAMHRQGSLRTPSLPARAAAANSPAP